MSKKEWFLAYNPTVPHKTGDEMRADLEKYKQMALDGGATFAAAVPTSQVVIDLRVRAKARFPSCMHWGVNANCGPYTFYPWEDIKKLLSSYKNAIIFQYPRKPEDGTGPLFANLVLQKMYSKYEGERAEETLKKRGYGDKIWEAPETEETKIPSRGVVTVGGARIARAIEQQAKKDGHHYSCVVGTGGPCRGALCRNFATECVALKTDICRYPGRTRPNATCFWGLDYMATAINQGWGHELGGFSIHAEDIPDNKPITWEGIILID